MKPLAGVFLALACVLGIASTGCVFELAYGDPDLGVKTTSWILALAAPGTVGTLLFAIRLNSPACSGATASGITFTIRSVPPWP